MGGVSDGFALEGFDVTGIDIADAPKMLGYKHRFIQANMLKLKGQNFRGYDVIWGSPPCREFSNLAIIARARLARNQKGQWKTPPNLANGMKLVYSFLTFTAFAKPKIWIMENVANLERYLPLLKPIALGVKIGKGKRHVFYGNLKPFLLVEDRSKEACEKIKSPIKSWERAKIPLSLSRTFAKACKEVLEVEVQKVG